MFCTVNFIETKKRFSRNLVIEDGKIGNIEFKKVTVYKISAIKKAEKKLKTKVDFAIVSKNLKNHNFECFNVFNNNPYLKNVAKHTFKYILNLIKINPSQLSVCIVDENCEHPKFVQSMAQRAGIIKVVTNSLDKYLSVSEGVLEDFGTSLVIKTTVQDADIGIFLDEAPRIWFGNRNNCFEINDECVKIGAGLKKFVPQGISQCDFAGAIHKYNEFKRLKLLNSTLLFSNGNYYEINKDNIKKFLDNK